MWDILSFKTFISPNVLVLFYYTGAVGIPIVLWYFQTYLLKKPRIKSNALMWVGFIVMIIFAELFWRMIFEMLIGYFDIHNYLQKLNELGD